MTRVHSPEAGLIPTERTDVPAANRHEAWAQAVGRDPRLAGFVSDEKAASVICALHGHAVVEVGCFGYWHCDRCGDQVGDSLGGSHTVTVIREHDCEKCRDGWSKANFWQRFGVEPDGTGFLQQPDPWGAS